MKFKLTFALLLSAVPMTSFAQPRAITLHSRTQVYHDRAPRPHDRGAKLHMTSINISRS